MQPRPILRAEDIDQDGLRREFLESLDPLGDASQALHQALDAAAAAFAVVRSHLQQEGKARDLVDVFDPAALRASLSTALDDLEQTRHRMQRLLFRLLWSEGMSMSDIGRAWGVSRQLVSRFVNEQ